MTTESTVDHPLSFDANSRETHPSEYPHKLYNSQLAYTRSTFFLLTVYE